MFSDSYQIGLCICASAGCAAALWAYGSYAGDFEGYSLLATTGALSGVAYWLLYINDYVGIRKT